MLVWLVIIGIGVVVLGYTLGLAGRRMEGTVGGGPGPPDVLPEEGDDSTTQLMESGAILVRVGAVVLLVGLLGWDLFKWLVALATGLALIPPG